MAISMQGLENTINQLGDRSQCAMLQYYVVGSGTSVSFTGDVWSDVPFNREVFDPFNLVSLPSTTWTQQPGTYIASLQWADHAANTYFGAFRIANSAGTSIAQSINSKLAGGSDGTRNTQTISMGFTLGAETSLKVQIYPEGNLPFANSGTVPNWVVMTLLLSRVS